MDKLFSTSEVCLYRSSNISNEEEEDIIINTPNRKKKGRRKQTNKLLGYRNNQLQ